MGLIDFVKDAGEKLFGRGQAQAAAKEAAAEPSNQAKVQAANAAAGDAILEYVAPLVGIALVGLFLYFLGFIARSRVIRLFDTFLLRVPIVTSIYSAASRMFQSLGGAGDMSRFKRVVLVSFPHLGMRVPAFVTSSCRRLRRCSRSIWRPWRAYPCPWSSLCPASHRFGVTSP